MPVPDYVKTDWVDNTTPVDEARMDHMEAGIDAATDGVNELEAAIVTQLAPKVDKDAVEIATARLVAVKLASGDAQPSFRILGDGSLEWGAGGASAPDVLLKRNAANVLELADHLFLHRSSTGFTIFSFKADADAGARLQMLTNGEVSWGDGTGALDVNLKRSAANVLASDDKFDPASLNLQVKAGIPVDGDIVGGAADGDTVLDTTNGRLYVRQGGVWKYLDFNATPGVIAQNNQSGTTYTLALSDTGKLITLFNAAAVTLTVPTNVTVAFVAGAQIHLVQWGAGQVTISPAGGVTIASRTGLKTTGQYAGATLTKISGDTWSLVGDLIP